MGYQSIRLRLRPWEEEEGQSSSLTMSAGWCRVAGAQRGPRSRAAWVSTRRPACPAPCNQGGGGGGGGEEEKLGDEEE